MRADREEFARDVRVIEEFMLQHLYDMCKPATDRLRYPFMDPGGYYGNNLWDWDSYWAGRAMVSLCDYFAQDACAAQLRETTAKHIAGSVRNFLDMMEPDGFVPIMTTEDGVLERELRKMHAEGCVNQHKPFLAQNAKLAADFTGQYDWVSERFEGLERYFDFYRRNQKSGCGLYVFNNDVMIGVDNNPGVFARPPRSCADLLLNVFLVEEFRAMAGLAERVGKSDRVKFYEEEAEALAAAVNELCYDEYYGFYFPVDVQVETHRSEHFHHGLGAFWKVMPLKIRSFLGFLPMTAGIASEERAAVMVERHFRDERMVAKYGVRTLASDERMYSLEKSNNPSNWLGPVWGISNYLVFEGLRRYGYMPEAEELCEKTVALFAKDIREYGALSESYLPDTGEPMLYHGFLNWNVLVLDMVKKCRANREEDQT